MATWRHGVPTPRGVAKTLRITAEEFPPRNEHIIIYAIRGHPGLRVIWAGSIRPAGLDAPGARILGGEERGVKV